MEGPSKSYLCFAGHANSARVLLLTVGFDKNTDCYWDAGTLSFTIHKKDLAAGELSNVVAFIESS